MGGRAMNPAPCFALPEPELQSLRVMPARICKKILLVDDDPAVRESVARVLTGEDYDVLTAANGLEALDLAAANEVDLVLLDLNLPKKNGWDTFELMTRHNPK